MRAAIHEALEKALAALATDPVTGDPLPAIDLRSLAIGLAVAVPSILGGIAILLGLGGGR